MIGAELPTASQGRPTLLLRLLLSLAATLFIATPISRLHWGLAYLSLTGLVLATALVAAATRRSELPGRRLRPLQRFALGYAGLVFIAALSHGAALALLEPSRPVAVGGATAAAALQGLLEETPLHLALPLALFATSVLVELRPHESWRRLPFLPWLLLPSALVALFQATVRLELWNVPHFVLHRRASGLGYDANSLAACIFLLLPLLFLRSSRDETPTRLVARASFALLLLAALVATGNRTALAGTAAWVALLPFAVSRVAAAGKRRRYAARLFAPALVAAGFLLLLAAAGRTGDRLVGAARLADAYERFHDDGASALFEASGRLALWRPALWIWAEAPIAGVGPGGYIRELSNVRFRFSDAREEEPIDHAASHYLQVASELGAIGLIAAACLLVVPTWRIAQAARRDPDTRSRRLLATIACVLVVALPLLQFNHYGLFPDVAWVLALLLAFADAAGPASAVQSSRAAHRRPLVAAGVLAGFAVASAAVAFGPNGYAARATSDWWPFRYDEGCYASETWDRIPTRWCAPSAWLSIPVRWPGDRAAALRLVAHHPDLATRPLRVRLRLVDGRTWSLAFEAPSWQTLSIPLDADSLVACQDAAGRRARCLAIHLDAARGWRPSDWGESADDRWLGVAVQARPLPDLTRLPGHLFDDGFERGDLGRWRVGEDEEPGLPSAAEAAEPRGGG